MEQHRWHPGRPRERRCRRPAAQAALIGLIPATIGNLGGIAYTHRDLANRSVHKAELASLQKIEKKATALIDAGDTYGYEKLLTDHGYDAGTFWAALSTSADVQKTLESARNIEYHLIQYQPGSFPLAAIAVGNMDTATQVTTNIPGMGTTVESSIREWTGAAENLYFEQFDMNEANGRSEAGLAVVSWVGYEAPRMATDGHLDVLATARAEAGGRNLSSFLESVTATRAWAPGENLSVVAHSYGTTAAGYAIADTPVENLTLVASAGLDPAISTVDQLKVDPTHVWATEAKGDDMANVGRGSVDISPQFGVRALQSEHPVSPTEPGFGAQVFSSEASTIDGIQLRGSDGHSAAPQVRAGIDGKEENDYGYLDRDTTPLRNTALSSLGRSEEITVEQPSQLIIQPQLVHPLGFLHG